MQSLKKFMILILGDSHARSFSYHSEGYPIFLTSGKHLLINTEEQLAQTCKKILNFLALISSDMPVAILIGEPSLRFFIEGIQKSRQVLDGKSVKKYAEDFAYNLEKLKREISRSSGSIPLLLPPVPRRDESYAFVWNHVIAELKHRQIVLADVFDDSVTGNGKIKDEYFGDFIHANEKLADLFYKRLGSNCRRSSNADKWRFRYNFPTGETIWGETDISFLRYSGTVSRDLDKACHVSVSLSRLIRAVDRIDALFFRKNKVSNHLNTMDEGAWGFYSREYSIVAIESKKRNLRTEFLSRFFCNQQPRGHFKRLILDEKTEKEAKKNLDKYDEIIIFGQEHSNSERIASYEMSSRVGSVNVRILSNSHRVNFYKFLIRICDCLSLVLYLVFSCLSLSTDDYVLSLA